MDRSGHIYILANPSMPGLLKIGRTRGLPSDRARALSAHTGIPSPFAVEYEAPVTDCIEAEKVVHHSLRAYRTTDQREFFQLGLQYALEVVADVLETNGLLVVPDPEPPAVPELLSRTGPCPICKVSVSFVDVFPTSKKFCLHGHAVSVLDLPEPTQLPPAQAVNIPGRRSLLNSPDSVRCGICGGKLTRLASKGSDIFRCLRPSCHERFPVVRVTIA